MTVPTPLAAPEMPTPDPIGKGAPHSGDVTELAVTEEGDAALTADVTGSLRLWPALDGSRPPVPIRFGSEAAQLAIAHAGRDLAAIVRDRAGAVTVLRLGLDGSLRGRVQIGDRDATFDEVVVSGGNLFVRTSEHLIECYALDGTLRGRLEPEPGQRVTDLAARGGRVVAITQDVSTAYLRWIQVSAFDGGVQWEEPLKLPAIPRPDMFAIAPTKRRVGFVDVESSEVQVLDIDWVSVPVPGTVPYTSESHKDLGFLDDDTIAVVGFNVAWWEAKKPPPGPDPVEPERPELEKDPIAGKPGMSSLSAGGAFGGGKLVSYYNGSLVLATRTNVQYLGYTVPASGGLYSNGSQLVLSQSGSRYTWLSEDLVALRSLDLQELKTEGTAYAYGSPIGTHHVFSQSRFNDDSSTLEIIDAEDPTRRTALITKVKGLDQYFPGDTTVGIKLNSQLRRFKIDLATMATSEMQPPIKLTDYSLNFVQVFDPEVADGLLAVTVGWPREYSEYQALTFYRLVNGKVEKTRDAKWTGQVLRAMPDGELVVLQYDEGAHIRVLENGERVREVTHGQITAPYAVDNEVKHVAARKSPTELVLFDDQGNERWTKTMWGISTQTFSPDGKRLILTAPGGLVALDSETGAIVGKECGFEFGLHDKPAAFGAHGIASVCEDPIVE